MLDLAGSCGLDSGRLVTVENAMSPPLPAVEDSIDGLEQFTQRVRCEFILNCEECSAGTFAQ
jgi:hypothetical protein